MEIQGFIKNFADQFDETDTSQFSSETRFRNIENWSSLTALSIIAMVDEQYGVNIKGNDIRSSETIGDLYKIVKLKL